MYFNRTVCFKIIANKFQFGSYSMISQPLPNLRTQFSTKDEVGTYDNIALNQRHENVVISLNDNLIAQVAFSVLSCSLKGDSSVM